MLNKKEAAATHHKESVNKNDSNIITSGNLASTLCLASKSMLHTWIIDSGVTDHMCNTINLFTNVRDVDSNVHEVIIPNGSSLKVTKIGDICFNEKITLKDVLYVPSIHYNLLLVHKFCFDNAISLIFHLLNVGSMTFPRKSAYLLVR